MCIHHPSCPWRFQFVHSVLIQTHMRVQRRQQYLFSKTRQHTFPLTARATCQVYFTCLASPPQDEEHAAPKTGGISWQHPRQPTNSSCYSFGSTRYKTPHCHEPGSWLGFHDESQSGQTGLASCKPQFLVWRMYNLIRHSRAINFQHDAYL